MKEVLLRAIRDRCRVAPNGLAAKLRFKPKLAMDLPGGFSVLEPAIEVILGPKADFGPASKLKVAIYCRAKVGLLEVAFVASIDGLHSNLRSEEPLFSVELADPRCLEKLAEAIAPLGINYACPPQPTKKRQKGRVCPTTPPC
jgi:hypothetical protein